MKKYLLPLLLIVFLLTSCDANIFVSETETLPTVTASAVSGVTSLDSPTVYATYGSYSDRISLSWSTVSNASSYRVLRSSGTERPDASAAITVTGNRYVDTNNITAGVEYNYWVQAQYTEGAGVIRGEWSACATGYALASPDELTVSAGDPDISEGISISFTLVPGAKSYDLYKIFDHDTELVDTFYYDYTGEGVSIPDYVYHIGSDWNNSDEAGQLVYFYVVAKNGSTEAEPGPTRSGYSYVVGSPTALGNFTVDKAASATISEGIGMQWDKPADHDNYEYYIYRSKAGGAEELIFPLTSYAQEAAVYMSADDSYVYYTDNRSTSSLAYNTEYTYRVYATTTVTDSDNVTTTYLGTAVSDSGYFLSPVTELSLEGIASDSTGFSASFYAPIGFRTDNAVTFANAEYVVYSSAGSELYTYEPFGSNLQSDGYYDFVIKYDNANTSFYVTLRLSETLESEASEVVSWSGLPCPDDATVYQNVHFSGQSASSGIYPTRFEFTPDVGTASIKVEKTAIEYRFDGNVTSSTSSTLSLSGYTLGSKFVYDDSDVSIGTMYQYTLTLTDVFGFVSSYDIGTGYGAITPERFIWEMEANALKPWEHTDCHSGWSESRIWSYIKQNGTGSLGEATDYGYEYDSDGQGSVYYKAVTSGLSGSVTLSYTNFGVVPYIWTSGSFNMVVSLSGSGTVSSSGLTVKGMYGTNTVSLSEMSISSNAFSGKYIVTMESEESSVSVAPNQANP